MHNPIKVMFFIGVGIVGSCAVMVNAIQNNKTKIKALIKSVIETWEKTAEIEEASVVRTSPLDEVKSNVEITVA